MSLKTAGGREHRINWITSSALIFLHAGALAALFTFTWERFWTAFILYWMAIGFGIGMGYHRLLTHRSYKVPKPLEYFFAICGTLTLEGGPIFWVGTHRIHHQVSDRDGDPHSPRDGAFWAHMGWIIFGQAMHNETESMGRYAPDMYADPFYRWLNNYHYVPLVILGVICLAIGGWPLVWWAVCLRVTLGLHATWLVNSATHMWGERRFHTKDDSRNNWWVALLTFGEGWHNNHHAHPASARHGLAWYELDITWLQIRLLQAIGIAKSVRVAKLPENEEQRKIAA
ncbi:MAG TPA: fatty acid desaturase [Bryobacteraceae bacterium]|nr:fatty acid desaturase [Bryobacteraceae bacterium]